MKVEINKLIEKKSAGAELDYGDSIPVISDFIVTELERMEESQNNIKIAPRRLKHSMKFSEMR